MVLFKKEGIDMRENKLVSEEKLREQRIYMKRVREMAPPSGRAFIQTFGCQQNEADSELLAGMLCEMGYSMQDEPENADVILVNTCAIREHAELKALSITGQFKHLKAKKPSLMIGICGCMVTQEHRKEDIKQKYPYVDFLFDTHMLYRFPEILFTALNGGKRMFYLTESDGEIAEGLPIRRESNTKAWVSIMYGCNNFCTYCIVPYVRGRERSRMPEVILQEIRELAANGYKEITLLGQNVNSYGKDLRIAYDFSDLLADIDKINGDFSIRFMTSHPKDASQKLIDTMAASQKIAPHLHLPLQAGSDSVLQAMNRHYTKEHYLKLVQYFREKLPDAALTTDIIVGFPGETEADFAQTLDMLKTVRYDNIYSFIYSPRKGTPAAKMDTQIPDSIKKDRFARLIALQNQISKEKNEERVGTMVSVLVEGRSKTDESKLTGRTGQNTLVHFSGDDALIGQRVPIRIVRAEAYAVYGELPEITKESCV